MEAEIGPAATGQGVQLPEVGRVKERSSPRAQWALPSDTLISDFERPEL